MYLQTALIISIILIMALAAVWTVRSFKAKKRILEAENMKKDAMLQKESLKKELLELKLRMQNDELEKAQKDNVELGTQLAQSSFSDEGSIYRDMMEQRVKKEQKEFLDKVNKDFPRLGYNDSLILGYMKMGLGYQEIAAALGIAPKSLTRARCRLQQKMGLQSLQELSDYVSSAGND